jgi:preprotein translocase subunit SecE
VSRERRQRAKQRTRRRGESGNGGLVRADVPGALDHASADVDEFDAALLRGSGGVPVPAADVEQAEQSTEQAPETETAGGGGASNGGRGTVGNAGEAAAAELPAPRERPAAPAAARGPLPSRAAAFLRASWAELQRVQWPDRPEVFQATAVVLGFVAVMGLYLGAADWVAQKIVNFIL